MEIDPMAERRNMIDLNVRGIKCDTVGCGWIDCNVIVEDYIQWLNKPCPSCGGNLLTQKDYDTVVKMTNVVEKFNQFIKNWLPFLAPKKNDNMKGIPLDMNGSGKIWIKPQK